MIKPIRDKILIKPFLEDEMSAGGIVVPESFRGRTSKGIVVAVGSGTKDNPMEFKEGYTVWHIKGAGEEVIENGQSYFIMPSNEVRGYLKN